ncbi:hypothetical protein KVH27_26300 [Streptomyces olivaceus]|uniref:hypothetical protein n=1 Tax=Streptomyces olivaceus TaxID=47716 RepID=UPI001CCC2C62|nr:hypothetical protein [Streptomyces olivaceus]MBZ6251862.1 hypothetical protein [Streptomyces olivaceus]
MAEHRPGSGPPHKRYWILAYRSVVTAGDGSTQNNTFAPKAGGWARTLARTAVLVALPVLCVGGNDTAVESSPPPGNTASAAPGPVLPGPSKSPTPSHHPRPGPTEASPTGQPATPPAPRPVAPAPSTSAPAPGPSASSRPPAAPVPSPTRNCRTQREYRVTAKGQIWDAEGNRVGDVASGTLFFRQEVASYPEPVDDRFYGTVDAVLSGSPNGYVLRKKLDFVKTVEICDQPT